MERGRGKHPTRMSKHSKLPANAARSPAVRHSSSMSAARTVNVRSNSLRMHLDGIRTLSSHICEGIYDRSAKTCKFCLLANLRHCNLEQMRHIVAVRHLFVLAISGLFLPTPKHPPHPSGWHPKTPENQLGKKRAVCCGRSSWQLSLTLRRKPASRISNSFSD